MRWASMKDVSLLLNIFSSIFENWYKRDVSLRLLNILQDSSFSNQISFILHIQGVFNLPGRGFRQRIMSMLNDVIVYVRQFAIAICNKPSGSGKLEYPSTETRAITNCLTCTMTSFSVIGTNEVDVIR